MIQLDTFREELKTEATENILRFWSSKMVDDVNGGFYGATDFEGNVDVNAEKGMVLNARILWTFSAAYRMFGTELYLEMAKRAKEYIDKYFWDYENGGVYWLLNAKGKPTYPKKQTYAQAFALYGYSEYYRATKCEDAFKRMFDLETFIERNTWDINNGGYVEAVDIDATMLDDMRLSEKDINAPKTNNTHLHILEAYANLYRAYPTEHTRLEIEGLLKIYKEKIITSRPSCEGFFSIDWKAVCDFQSYGHDIEGAWLLWDAVETIDSKYRNWYEKIVIDMVDESIDKGLDRKRGGLFYEKMEGKPRCDEKHWWPQAEAILGLLNAYQITGKEDYLNMAGDFWGYTRDNIVDHKNGEWFTRRMADDSVNTDEAKAGPWKCPYHNGRACFEGILRLDAIKNS